MTVIRWNPERNKWMVLTDGAPVASSVSLERLTRHWPDAEVIDPTAA